MTKVAVGKGSKGRKTKYEKRFYTLGDSEGKPLVTVCIMNNAARTKFARGVAICGPDENPIKTKGKNMAYGRAIEAINSHLTTDVIRRSEAMKQLAKVKAFDKGSYKMSECKSVYFDTENGLTKKEREMICTEKPIKAAETA